MTLRTLWFGLAALVSAFLTLAYLRRPVITPPRHVPTIPARSVSVLNERKTTEPLADSIVAQALRLLGTDYCYAGTTPENGFDCSGFVTYVFSRFGLAVPHGSSSQASVGRFVSRAEAQPADIIIFTGTDPARREPGHAGIVISRPGTPLRFVHASSARRNPGVQIDQVDGTRYETRFLQIRRVIGELPSLPTGMNDGLPVPRRRPPTDSLPLDNAVRKPASVTNPRRAARRRHRRRAGRTGGIHLPHHPAAGSRDRHAGLRYARPARRHLVR